MPQACDCEGQCSGGCTAGVGLCEPAAGCDPGTAELCASGCPAIASEVCGADGRTYANECLAECQCAGVAADGPCAGGAG